MWACDTDFPTEAIFVVDNSETKIGDETNLTALPSTPYKGRGEPVWGDRATAGGVATSLDPVVFNNGVVWDDGDAGVAEHVRLTLVREERLQQPSPCLPSDFLFFSPFS